VARLRGTVQVQHTLYALTGGQAVQMVRAGLEAWQLAAGASRRSWASWATGFSS